MGTLGANSKNALGVKANLMYILKCSTLVLHRNFCRLSQAGGLAKCMYKQFTIGKEIHIASVMKYSYHRFQLQVLG